MHEECEDGTYISDNSCSSFYSCSDGVRFQESNEIEFIVIGYSLYSHNPIFGIGVIKGVVDRNFEAVDNFLGHIRTQ